jgi:hypothetical protein
MAGADRQIVLLSGDKVGTMAIQRQTGKGKPTIWRWQARFMAEGGRWAAARCDTAGPQKPLSASTRLRSSGRLR